MNGQKTSVLAIVALMVLLGACGGNGSVTAQDETTTTEFQLTTPTTEAPSVLEAAVDECDLASSPYVDVDEAGLFIDGDGDDSSGASIDDVVCLVVALEVPDSVISRMDSTTSLMGVQEASFRGLEISWTYHPSNGVDITFVEE